MERGSGTGDSGSSVAADLAGGSAVAANAAIWRCWKNVRSLGQDDYMAHFPVGRAFDMRKTAANRV